MKRNLYLLLIVFVLMPFSVFGQSYKDLWKQSDEAVQKDLPKTQLTILEKIIKKADKEKQYGHLLKAHLMHATYQLMLSPDSLDSISRERGPGPGCCLRLHHLVTLSQQHKRGRQVCRKGKSISQESHAAS